ncbi:hypothetical protein JXA32_12050 [Candidatus Sumerlaeota bacterium]|nr:hypothetical protein [Candidatus Sumerlaeota bacterium]
MNKNAMCFILAAFALCAIQLLSAAPGLMSYQGKLTDKSDAPITVPVTVTFTFWDAETGGNQLGNGFYDADIVTPDSAGVYATMIGDDPDNLVPDAIFQTDVVYLNININGENLLPRKRVASTGYTMNANNTYSFIAGEALQPGDLVQVNNSGQLQIAGYPGHGNNYSFFPHGIHSIRPTQLSTNRYLLTYGSLLWGGCWAQVLELSDTGPSFSSPTKIVTGSAVSDTSYAVTRISDSKVVIMYVEGDYSANHAVLAKMIHIDGMAIQAGEANTIEPHLPFMGIGIYVYYNALNIQLIDSQRVLATYHKIPNWGEFRAQVLSVDGDIITTNPAFITSTYNYSELIPTTDSNTFYAEMTTDQMLQLEVDGVTVTQIADISMPEVEQEEDKPPYLILLPDGRYLRISQGNSGGAYHNQGAPLYASILTIQNGTATNTSEIPLGVGIASNDCPMNHLFLSDQRILLVPGCEYCIIEIQGDSINVPITGAYSSALFAPLPQPILYADDQVYILYVTIESNGDTDYLAYYRYAPLADFEQGLRLTNFIGIAERAAQPGEYCRVTLPGGITRQFNDLKIGRTYYATENGLSESGSVVAGYAVATDKLMVWR